MPCPESSNWTREWTWITGSLASTSTALKSSAFGQARISSPNSWISDPSSWARPPPYTSRSAPHISEVVFCSGRNSSWCWSQVCTSLDACVIRRFRRISQTIVPNMPRYSNPTAITMPTQAPWDNVVWAIVPWNVVVPFCTSFFHGIGRISAIQVVNNTGFEELST